MMTLKKARERRIKVHVHGEQIVYNGFKVRYVYGEQIAYNFSNFGSKALFRSIHSLYTSTCEEVSFMEILGGKRM